MNNYHIKQKDNKSFNRAIKRFTSINEIDTNINSLYLYVAPFSHKSKHKVNKIEQIDCKFGTIVLDFSDDKLCGVEILDASRIIDLEKLNIKQENVKNDKVEIDGNK